MYGQHDTVNARERAGRSGKVRFKRWAAVILCAALLVSTVPMDTRAACDTAFPATEEQPDVETVSGGGSGGRVQEPEDAPGGAAAEGQPGGSHLPSENASVSMSDMMMYSEAALAEEQLTLNMQWPANCYNNGILTLKDGKMFFEILPGLSGSTVETPVLEIWIPSCMEVTAYPDESNESLKDYLASSNPVSKRTDSSGNTILTYRFVSRLAWVNFSVSTQISSGSRIEDGKTYSIKLRYYDGTPDKPVRPEEKIEFTTKKTSAGTGSVGLDSATVSFTQTLEDGVSAYDIGPYNWTIMATGSHSPYKSLKMVVPLPPGAVPVFWNGSSYTPFANNETKQLSSCSATYYSNYSYKNEDGSITGNAGALIYEIPEGTSFLTSGTTFSFGSYYQNIYLRFTNPEAKTYQSAVSPRIECVVDGKTVVMRDYDTNDQYRTRVSFIERSEWLTVRPYQKWDDTIYLKENVRIYDTTPYVREVYAVPGEHVSYDSLKMTVPLPEGAVPVIGKGDSFTELVPDQAYDNGSYWVTYRQGVGYSNADGSVSGQADMLVYELRSGGFLSSASESVVFTFSGNRELRLRFTDPKAGTYRSAASPKVEVTRNGRTTTRFDFDRTSYLTTVTVIEPSASCVYSDFDAYSKRWSTAWGWADTVNMELNKTVYDTKLYERKVFSSVPHYPYDLVRMTVLLPDEAVPGFGTGDAFTPLKDGETYTISASYNADTWTVTYHEQYSYANEDKTVSGTAKALVYELSSRNSSAAFLKNNSPAGTYTSFTFTTYRSDNRLYLRFTDPKPGTYSSAASPKVECMMDGKLYVTPGYFSQTTPEKCDTAVTFESPKIDWTRVSLSGGANETALGLSPYTVLPEDYQNDKEFYGYITNNTGYTLKDVRVLYTFDAELNADKLKLELDGSGGPANAVVVYTTRLDETEKTVHLDASNNVLALERGNSFRTAEITYDTLESTADRRKVLTASLHNYERLDALRYITAAFKAANSDLGNGDGQITVSLFRDRFYLTSTLSYLWATAKTVSDELSPTGKYVLNKSGEFTVNVNTYTANYFGKFQNLSLYLRMPKGYILTGYVPPAECRDGEYSLTSRSLQNGDILYCLEYTDNIMYNGGIHAFSFRVGVEADTSTTESQDISIPKVIYASVGKDKLFQFNPVQSEDNIGWDVNGNGDTTDSFYQIPGSVVTVRPMGLIDIAGYISVNGQIGEDRNNAYTCNSSGNSHLIIYNGKGTNSSSMSDATVTIVLHKKGDTFTYSKESYTSQFDVLLTGPVKPRGEFLEDCTVQYSPDGQDWLPEEQVEDFTAISYIRVHSAKDHVLRSKESAYLDFPFDVGFPGSGTAENAYIEMQMQYALDTGPASAHTLNVLTAKPIGFSGTVFQDRNHNGKQDAEESSNDKEYTLRLYSGTGTDGALLQEFSTDPVSGKYSFDVLLPGTYTLHVEKEDDEFYGTGGYFDGNGNYTFTLGRDLPMPVTRKLDMGILAQSVLEKPQFMISPDLPDGKDGWYITLPQITLLPMVSSADVDTMFWHNGEPEQKLAPETQPSVKETGVYAFKAYNVIPSESGTVIAVSDTAALDCRVDVDAPVIGEDFSYSVPDMSGQSTTGNFRPFGCFFNKAIQITVKAEDVGSGVDALYYTLPGEEVQSVKPDEDGAFRFDIPMNTAGKITYYVEDKAGNTSGEVTLRKGEGSEWWVIEDQSPVWKDFGLTDLNGRSGVRGADGNLWFSGSVNASAPVTDEDSGLARVTGRINEGSARMQELTGDEKVTAFEFTAAVETEGINRLGAEAEDNAANVSETQTVFGIDRTPPVIVLEEKSLAPASEEGAPADDELTVRVLLRDTGSGIDPDSIHVLWQGKETEFQTTPAEDGYRLTFSMEKMAYTDREGVLLVTAEDYTGWDTMLSVTRYQDPIIYVAADTGSDVTGDGSRTFPVQTLGAALERVAPGGRIVLLEDYNGTAYVALEATLDLNGKVLHADAPGSAVTVGSAGKLTIVDSNGSASAAEGFGSDPESEGEVFGGNPGDTAFTLDGGTLCLADGTIYCGYVGDGSIEIRDAARMMYLLTYLSGGGTGVSPGLHYIEEDTADALKQNTFSREGYAFHGWLYEDRLYDPGQEILMPGRNMEALAKWVKSDNQEPPVRTPKSVEEAPEPEDESVPLDRVPKTGNGEADRGGSNVPQAGHIELYIEIRKKEDEQDTED